MTNLAHREHRGSTSPTHHDSNQGMLIHLLLNQTSQLIAYRLQMHFTSSSWAPLFYVWIQSSPCTMVVPYGERRAKLSSVSHHFLLIRVQLPTFTLGRGWCRSSFCFTLGLVQNWQGLLWLIILQFESIDHQEFPSFSSNSINRWVDFFEGGSLGVGHLIAGVFNYLLRGSM